MVSTTPTMAANASISRRMVTMDSTTVVATVVITTTMTSATPTSASAYAIPRRAPTTIAFAIFGITIAVRCVESTTAVLWLRRNTIGWELTIPSVSSPWWRSLSQLLVAMWATNTKTHLKISPSWCCFSSSMYHLSIAYGDLLALLHCIHHLKTATASIASTPTELTTATPPV